MIISKYLQKLFFLLMMGGALCTLQACGDDEKDEPVQKPNEEETVKPDDGKEEEKPSDKPSDTMEAVDLGLPSGTLWATCNVGASSPEEYGGYYAWGETEEKEDYSWETYKWCNGSSETLIKYCTDSDYGTVDSCMTLTSSDDVATVKWGDKWRMPTRNEFWELIYECTWTWETREGCNGYKITGANGNSIFLPYAIHYWSATLREYRGYNAYSLAISSGGYSVRSENYYRYAKGIVRPVQSGKAVTDSSSENGYTGTINKHNYVDLGLSVKWATCNVGASSPEEYGGYYAWGEIEEKIDYKWNTYKWCDGGMHNMTKYCTNSFKNPDGIDDKTVLDPKDDVAHIEWGEGWRMPTKVEVGELYENCVWESASYNKIFGVLITGRNGNSIFLPAAGYRSNFEQRLGDVYYWTSTLDESTDCNSAYRLYYNSDWGCSSYWRCYGIPVRPVCD